MQKPHSDQLIWKIISTSKQDFDLSTACLAVCSVDIGSSESFLHNGELPTLVVQSTGHALHVFVNGQLSGKQLNPFFFQALYIIE